MMQSKYPETIVSGGQTGADQGALRASKDLGLRTGGTAPKGWVTEEGPQQTLLRSFGLKECSESGYDARTKANVLQSDGTLIVGSYRTGGSALTAKLCNDNDKPLFHVPYDRSNPPDEERIEDFRYWLNRYHIRVLNVAGNRESQNPGISRFTRDFLMVALSEH